MIAHHVTEPFWVIATQTKGRRVGGSEGVCLADVWKSHPAQKITRSSSWTEAFCPSVMTTHLCDEVSLLAQCDSICLHYFHLEFLQPFYVIVLLTVWM